MSKRDYYDVLGVTRGADDAAIKAAFRKAAKECHPDVNAHDTKAEAKFKELSEAYEVLKDPQKKAAYDQFGHAPSTAAWAAARAACTASKASTPGSAFSDIFEGPLRRTDRPRPPRRRRRTQPRRGPRIGPALQHDDQLERGLHRQGRADQSPLLRHLRTLRRLRRRARLFADPMPDLPRRRPRARGAGLLYDRAHLPAVPRPRPDHQRPVPPMRGGAGRLQKDRTLSVNIPAGVEDGTRIRLAGEGEGRRSRRAGGRSLHFPFRRPHEISSARREPPCPRAGEPRDGRSRRRRRRADPRRRPAPRSKFRKGRNPAASCACAARACRSCARNRTATSMSRSS